MTPTDAGKPQAERVVHVLWINAGLSCDGDSVSLTAAMQPSIENIAMGALPGPAEGRIPLLTVALLGYDGGEIVQPSIYHAMLEAMEAAGRE
jgi:hypothetical protein